MEILHLSHSSLPDKRVERSAYTAKKYGHVCHFAGSNPQPSELDKILFKEIINTYWSPLVKLHTPILWKQLKNKIKKIIQQLNPDIIHAHDVFAGRICLELESPFIYDSHEYWTPIIPLKYNASSFYHLKKWVSTNYAKQKWGVWQKEIVSQTPTLTVSRKIVEELKKYNCDVFFTPNFPTIPDVENIKFQNKHSYLSCVYIGNDLTTKSEHRDIQFIKDVFEKLDNIRLTIIGDNELKSSKNITSKGHMEYSSLLEELTRHHIGLLPWRPHSYHKYCLPNKAANYSHAGLTVLSSSSLKQVTKTLEKSCIVFDNIKDFEHIIRELVDKKEYFEDQSLKIVKYAKNNLIWERYEKNILRAYSNVMDN